MDAKIHTVIFLLLHKLNQMIFKIILRNFSFFILLDTSHVTWNYSFFWNHVPNDVPYGPIHIKAPPTMLPRVTGIRFLMIIWEKVISAPRRIPNGMMNMFATEWSRPRATNADIGNQTAVIFPIIVEHPEAMYTAIQTSQLQRIPRTNATSKGRLHLAVAMAAEAGAFPNVPDLKAR